MTEPTYTNYNQKEKESTYTSVDQAEDLAIFVKRLVRLVKIDNPDSELASQAMDYLKRNNLHGSVTREDR